MSGFGAALSSLLRNATATRTGQLAGRREREETDYARGQDEEDRRYRLQQLQGQQQERQQRLEELRQQQMDQAAELQDRLAALRERFPSMGENEARGLAHDPVATRGRLEPPQAYVDHRTPAEIPGTPENIAYLRTKAGIEASNKSGTSTAVDVRQARTADAKAIRAVREAEAAVAAHRSGAPDQSEFMDRLGDPDPAAFQAATRKHQGQGVLLNTRLAGLRPDTTATGDRNEELGLPRHPALPDEDVPATAARNPRQELDEEYQVELATLNAAFQSGRLPETEARARVKKLNELYLAEVAKIR